MVRRERRSMAGGTIMISNSCCCSDCGSSRNWLTMTKTCRVKNGAVCYLAIGIIYILQMQHVTLALDVAAAAAAAAASSSSSAMDYSDEVSAAALIVGRSAHEPKFGERLLPLRKKTVNNLNSGASKGVGQMGMGAVGAASTHTEKNVNSLLNKSNYVVSHENSAKVVVRNANTNTNTNTYVKSENDAINLTDAELFTVAMSTLDDYETLPSSASKARQAKQLNRREDTNVADTLLEHAAVDMQSRDAASISKADRLVVMSTEFFVVPTPSAATTTSTTAPHRQGVGKSVGNLPAYIQPPHAGGPPRSVLIVAPKSTITNSSTSGVSTPTIIAAHLPFTGLRREPWVVPVLVLASLTMLMMGAFEIFVLFKAWRTSPSRRHLFLGQMLLLGLFACAGLGAIITAQPSLLSCGAIRFGVGVAYALVFAALLVKCVFLISLNGGVYLPAPYQGLLLLFAVLIQVAIGAQWLLTQPPEIYTLNVPILGSGLLATTVASSTQIAGGASSTSAASTFSNLFHPSSAVTADIYAAAGTVIIPLCKTQFSELLLSLIYIVFLIVFVAVLAIKSRGIRDNYREATYIGLAIGGAIPIWLGWMLCGLAVAERHKDACIAFGLVATSATVFLVMFMPKGRQLAAMGKEGLYVEDREEQFSSLSRAGSGYSPSFFHFKPIKYGVMGGGMQNSTSNTGNGASMKHCSNGLNGGDRVALVTAAPPSYTRMYHYFPAHLTTHHHHPFCFYPQPPPPPPPPMTQLPSPPTLKQLGNSLTSMTQAHIAQTLRYPGLFIRPDETNLYTTLEPTLSSNPNVYFQRGGAVHPGMMY